MSHQHFSQRYVTIIQESLSLKVCVVLPGHDLIKASEKTHSRLATLVGNLSWLEPKLKAEAENRELDGFETISEICSTIHVSFLIELLLLHFSQLLRYDQCSYYNTHLFCMQ